MRRWSPKNSDLQIKTKPQKQNGAKIEKTQQGKGSVSSVAFTVTFAIGGPKRQPSPSELTNSLVSGPPLRMLDFSGKLSPSGLLEEPLLHFFIFIQIKSVSKIRESSKPPTEMFFLTSKPKKNHQPQHLIVNSIKFWRILAGQFASTTTNYPSMEPELMLSAAKHVASTAVVIVLPVPGGPWFFQRILGITRRCQSEHVKINATPKWILE